MTDVSVLITAYNEEDTIRACVESVATQDTELDYQIVVCDDGSTDGTGDVLDTLVREYSDLVVDRPDTNQGQMGATQRAYRLAAGEFILRIDADCRLLAGSLDAFYREIQQSDIVYGKVHVENTDKVHPAACQLGKERGTGSWYGGACVGFQDHVIHSLNGFADVRQNVEREVMNRAETEGWSVAKVDDVAVTSVFPESITEWLPRKLSSGAVYVRECADSPSELDLWELRGPAFWTGLYGLSIVAWPIALLCFTFILVFNYEDARTIAKGSGKRRYLLLYPLYQVFSGMLRTLGVWKESPLLVKTLWRKYA